MDPTLANGQVETVDDNDLLAMNLIGYDLVSVPEPTTLLAGVACSVICCGGRGRCAGELCWRAPGSRFTLPTPI